MTIIRDLLRTLRGKRSQMTVSKKIGYSFNKVYRWESGKERMTWLDFVNYCGVLRVPLSSSLERHFTYSVASENYDALIRRIVGSTKTRDLSIQTGFSKKKIDRWLAGEVCPSLQDMLLLMDKTSGLSWDLLLDICPNVIMPKNLKHLDLVRMQKELFTRHPYALLIEVLFQTKEYRELEKHSEGFIGERLKITLDEEREILTDMIKYRVLMMANGKYVSNLSATFRTKPPAFPDHVAIINYWLWHVTETLKQQQKVDGFNDDISLVGYRVILASPESLKKIAARTREYYQEVGLILKSAPTNNPISANGLRVLNIQLFDPLYSPSRTCLLD